MKLTHPIALALVSAWTASAAAEPSDQGEPADDEVETIGEETIVVTATRSETPLAASPTVIEVIDRARIEQSGAETVADALAQRPGLWIERGIGGAGVTIGGLGPQYVLILVDGQRQIGRVGGTIDLDRFGVAELEQIEVVRGPSSALYGSDALGGVINLITRDADGTALDAAARIDSRLATDLQARAASGRDGWSGSLAGQWRAGDAIDLEPADPATTISAYRDGRVVARGSWRRDHQLRLEVAAEYLRRDLRGVDAVASGAVFDRRNLTETGSGRAEARWSGERTSLRGSAGVGVFRDQYLHDQRGSGALDRDEQTDERLVEAAGQIEHRLGDHHQTIGGGEVLRETLASARLSDDGARTRAALFVQHEWRIGAEYRLLIVPAARVDLDSQFGSHATPRLAVKWDPADRLTTRASAGFGYRAPSFKELLLRFENPGAGYVVEGNPELAPESSRSLQLGAEWRPSAWLWLAASAFHNELYDLITTVSLDEGGPGPLRFGYANLGRARTQGGEASAVAGRGRLSIELGWAYTRARDLDLDRGLEGIPAHRLATALRWHDRDDGLDAAVEATATGRRPYYLGADPAMATFTGRRVDLRARAAKRFASGLGCFLGVDNLLGAGDSTFDPIAPLTFYVGVDASLTSSNPSPPRSPP